MINEKIDLMSREGIKSILESYGFAVYDNESYDSLNSALKANVKDGTIIL